MLESTIELSLHICAQLNCCKDFVLVGGLDFAEHIALKLRSYDDPLASAIAGYTFLRTLNRSGLKRIIEYGEMFSGAEVLLNFSDFNIIRSGYMQT